MWPKLLDMSKDECRRLLRRTELEAYAGMVSAFRAQGSLTKEKKQLLNELATTLSISTERHRAEVRRAVNDEKLTTVAERLSGPNNSAEWSIEGRRLIPLVPRLVPQTVFSLTANQAANAAFSHNFTLPLPSETSKKEMPPGSENNGPSSKLPSPSSNMVVLPFPLPVPTKVLGGPDAEADGPPVKKSRRDPTNSQSKETVSSTGPTAPSLTHQHSVPSGTTAKSASGQVITTTRSLSLPGSATKNQPGYHVDVTRLQASRPVIGRSSPSIKAGFSPSQSSLRFAYSKSPTVTSGINTPTSTSQKVILVSSGSTPYTPSILQRSHSSPSMKSSAVKPGVKQSVILTGASQSPSTSRQPDSTHGVVSSSSHHQQSTVIGGPSAGRQKAAMLGKHAEVGSGHVTSPEVLPGGRKIIGNIGPSPTSTVITARTTASVASTQVASFVSTNTAGKPRGRAVSKQKLLKHMNVAPTPPTGETTAFKKQTLLGKQDAGMKVVTQSIVTSKTPFQRSMSQPHTMDAYQKGSIATKPGTTVTGHKVIISTTSAGVAPQHVAVTMSQRTKPSTTITVGGAVKTIGSGIGGIRTANPRMVQTIKASSTSITSSHSSNVPHVIGNKPGYGADTVTTNASKHTQAHITTTSLLQRPRISMTSGLSTTMCSPSSTPSIRFPTPRSTNTLTMTSGKLPGSRRMRSPITMVTAGNSPNQQRGLMRPMSPHTPQGNANIATGDVHSTSKQSKDSAISLTRRLLGSHPNSEWIEYDGTPPPESSASSAIKALLEFRSHPADVRKQTQGAHSNVTLTAPGTNVVSMPTIPATHCITTTPLRLSQHALLTSRVSQHAAAAGAQPMVTLGSPFQSFPSSNTQSKLKRALLSDRPATTEVKKALLSKHEGPLKQPLEKTRSPGHTDTTVFRHKIHTETLLASDDDSQRVTIEDQGIVTERVSLTSEDVSSFVDQFEQFLESERISHGGASNESNDRPAVSESSECKQPNIGSLELLVRAVTGKEHAQPAQATQGSDWSGKSANQGASEVIARPSWGKNVESAAVLVPKAAASVVMESGSVDITQMKLEDFTSQRLQEAEENDEKQNTSPESSPVKVIGGSPSVCTGSSSGSGSEELQSIRISSRKRKAPPPIDEEPGPTSMSSWARAAFNLLQRVMRFRGANRSKGDLNAASWFTRPVAASEAPGYNKVIKTPMDLGTIKRKLESVQYEKFTAFHNDMMLVHSNCLQYNPPGHEIRRDCEEVFQFYAAEYNKLMERWEKHPSPRKPKQDDGKSSPR